MIYIDNKYSRCYFRLVERARGRVRAAGMERHHIEPRSLGGSNASENLVLLTYREHFLAHWLLTRMTEWDARRKMNFALGCLKRAGKWHTGRAITSWQYERAKRAYLEATRGRTLTASTKERMRVAALNRGDAYAAKMSALKTGGKLSAETKAKLSAANKAISPAKRAAMDAARRACGYRHSAEALAKMKAAHLGRVASAETKERLSKALTGNKNNLGRTRDAEARLNLSVAIRAAWADPQVHAKQSAAIREAARSPETRVKKSLAMAASWARRKAAAL